ncbi:hypothetical protein PFICI_06591 [Pestalotiopsis fici W106-1]|uniref:Uncharacterized protein n=1 Tax=Pestalotiopsis fici (strain W106-1 / CGMCC3.15140) TaxID=1229662 RepID=W3X6B9_PESFW|nr:uncharacterized protein PFICI_06591 [Pestalotiopsis fici W106-1]ETS81589.1 hypothetical protein PFICI_06591 [Pestalotiopsis fici W106-1]
MAGSHTRKSSEGAMPSRASTWSEKHTERYGSRRTAPRRQASVPAKRSVSEYSKETSVNTSKPDMHRHASSSAKKTSTTAPPLPRPAPHRANTSFQSRYVEMLLGLDTIPRMHNIYASFFLWIQLAGYVVFPGTFTSLQDLSEDPEVQANAAASAIVDHVKNVPLLIVAAVCCFLGSAGMVWLMIKWRRNYIWLLNRLLLPGATNALAGLISTIVPVYTQQNGKWSATAAASAFVEGCSLIICSVLFLFISQVLLARVKRKHAKEAERAMAAEGDESLLQRTERKLKRPPLEPGSVV